MKYNPNVPSIESDPFKINEVHEISFRAYKFFVPCSCMPPPLFRDDATNHNQLCPRNMRMAYPISSHVLSCCPVLKVGVVDVGIKANDEPQNERGSSLFRTSRTLGSHPPNSFTRIHQHPFFQTLDGYFTMRRVVQSPSTHTWSHETVWAFTSRNVGLFFPWLTPHAKFIWTDCISLKSDSFHVKAGFSPHITRLYS